MAIGRNLYAGPIYRRDHLANNLYSPFRRNLVCPLNGFWPVLLQNISRVRHNSAENENVNTAGHCSYIRRVRQSHYASSGCQSCGASFILSLLAPVGLRRQKSVASRGGWRQEVGLYLELFRVTPCGRHSRRSAWRARPRRVHRPNWTLGKHAGGKRLVQPKYSGIIGTSDRPVLRTTGNG